MLWQLKAKQCQTCSETHRRATFESIQIFFFFLQHASCQDRSNAQSEYRMPSNGSIITFRISEYWNMKHKETEPETTNFVHTPLNLVCVQRTFFCVPYYPISINLFIYWQGLAVRKKKSFCQPPDTMVCIESFASMNHSFLGISKFD